jgi:hypothetical protein
MIMIEGASSIEMIRMIHVIPNRYSVLGSSQAHVWLHKISVWQSAIIFMLPACLPSMLSVSPSAWSEFYVQTRDYTDERELRQC